KPFIDDQRTIKIAAMGFAMGLRNRDPCPSDIAVCAKTETRDDRLNLLLMTAPRLQFFNGAVDGVILEAERAQLFPVSLEPRLILGRHLKCDTHRSCQRLPQNRIQLSDGMAGNWNGHTKRDRARGHAAEIDIAIGNTLPEHLPHQGRRILLLW